MAALERRERDAVLRLTRAYGDIWKRLKGDLDANLARMEAARAASEPVGPSWVWTDMRLRALLAQVEAEIARWAKSAAGVAEELQREGVMAGLGEVGAQLQAQLPAGVVGTFDRLSRGAVEDLVGFGGDGGPLARLFDELGPLARLEMTRALVAGLGAGENPRKVAADLARKAMGVPLARGLTIARTEMLRAYREAGHRMALANQDVLRGWRWAAALSLRTCGSCVAMHGTWHRLDERLEDHPNGRCSAIYETKPWSELGFEGVPDTRPELPDAEAWLRGLSEADQARVLGNQGAALWRTGQVALHEFTERRDNAVWGAMRTLKPVSRILADKAERWARLGSGDVRGLKAMLAHFGFETAATGFLSRSSVLRRTRTVAGYFYGGIRMRPGAFDGLQRRDPASVVAVLHELFHGVSHKASGKRFDEWARDYQANRRLEEICVEIMAHMFARRALADMGGARIAVNNPPVAYHDWVNRFTGRLIDAGLSGKQLVGMIEQAMRVPPASRRQVLYCELADALKIRLDQAVMLVKEALDDSH